MDSAPALQTLARLQEHIETALQKAGIPTAAYAVVRNGETVDGVFPGQPILGRLLQ